MHKVLSSVLFTSMFVSANALATSPESVAARCDNCTALAAKQAATNIAYMYTTDPAATAAGYYGYVYSYDFQNGTITQYGVVLSQKQGQLVAMPTGQSAPANITNAYHTQRAAILANSASITFVGNATAPPGMPYSDRSAFEIAQTGAEQNAIANWLMSNSASNQWAVLGAVETVLLHDQPLSFDLTIQMSFDHSYITVEYVAGTAKKFKLISATDANLNPIPLTSNDVPGRYIFGNKGGSSFTGYLHDRFGFSTSNNVCVNGILACTDVAGSRACEWIQCGSP